MDKENCKLHNLNKISHYCCIEKLLICESCLKSHEGHLIYTLREVEELKKTGVDLLKNINNNNQLNKNKTTNKFSDNKIDINALAASFNKDSDKNTKKNIITNNNINKIQVFNNIVTDSGQNRVINNNKNNIDSKNILQSANKQMINNLVNMNINNENTSNKKDDILKSNISNYNSSNNIINNANSFSKGNNTLDNKEKQEKNNLNSIKNNVENINHEGIKKEINLNINIEEKGEKKLSAIDRINQLNSNKNDENKTYKSISKQNILKEESKKEENLNNQLKGINNEIKKTEFKDILAEKEDKNKEIIKDKINDSIVELQKNKNINQKVIEIENQYDKINDLKGINRSEVNEDSKEKLMSIIAEIKVNENFGKNSNPIAEKNNEPIQEISKSIQPKDYLEDTIEKENKTDVKIQCLISSQKEKIEIEDHQKKISNSPNEQNSLNSKIKDQIKEINDGNSLIKEEEKVDKINYNNLKGEEFKMNIEQKIINDNNLKPIEVRSPDKINNMINTSNNENSNNQVKKEPINVSVNNNETKNNFEKMKEMLGKRLSTMDKLNIKPVVETKENPETNNKYSYKYKEVETEEIKKKKEENFKNAFSSLNQNFLNRSKPREKVPSFNKIEGNKNNISINIPKPPAIPVINVPLPSSINSNIPNNNININVNCTDNNIIQNKPKPKAPLVRLDIPTKKIENEINTEIEEKKEIKMNPSASQRISMLDEIKKKVSLRNNLEQNNLEN